MKITKSFLIFFITISLLGCASTDLKASIEGGDKFIDLKFLTALNQLEERGGCCRNFSEFSFSPMQLNEPNIFYIRNESNQAFEFDDGLSYLAAAEIPEIEDDKTYRLSVDSFAIQLQLENESIIFAQNAIFRPSLLLLDKNFNTIKNLKHPTLDRPIKYYYELDIRKEDEVKYIVVFSKRRLYGRRDFGMSPRGTYNEDVALGFGTSQYGVVGGLIYADVAEHLSEAGGFIYSPVGHVRLTLSEIVEE